MKPGAQIDVAGTPVSVLSGQAWRLPDGTVIRCRLDLWGSPTWVIDDDTGIPLIVAESLEDAVGRWKP
jgi:hypothetical protein